MAYIKSRKHAPARQSALTYPAALGLMAIAMPVAAQTTPTQPAEPKPAASQEVTLPAVKAKAATESEFKAESMSSPKFTQPLVDTPQTITIIKKELLQQQSATTLTEALRNTPGITLQMGENGNTTTGDGIFMRGFDTANSIFVDGVRDMGAITRDMFNIEQVEVVKGPSGSDNGRGAASGYVNLVSKTAGQEAFNNGSVTIGTDQRLRATADLNRPLELGIPGSALRLNVMAQDYGVPGRDEAENKSFGFAPSLVFGLGTPTRATFNYLYVKQNNIPDGGVSTIGLPGYNYPANTLAGSPAVDRSNFYGSTGDFNDVTVNMFTAKIEHDFAPGIVLRNTSRLGHTEQDYQLTGVNGVNPAGSGFVTSNPATYTIARSRQGRHQTNEILTNQTNLQTAFKTGSVEHDLSTGVEFTYERQNQVNKSLPFGVTQDPANLYNPSTGDVFRDTVDTGAYNKGSTLTAAAYGFDTLKFGEQWLMTAGLRWEKFHTESNSASYSTTSGQTTQNGPLSVNDNLLSWKLGGVFKPTPTGSVYAAVSNSAQPPGGNNFQLANSGNSQNRTDFDPQEASNIELGTKWDLLDGKLGLTGAIYRAENKNEIVSDGGNPANYTQIGKRRVDGIELGVVGQVTPELNLNAGFAYMDSQILQGTTGASGSTGNTIVYTPKITFTSWVSYKLLPALTIGGGLRYVDTVSRTSNSGVTSGVVEIDDYWIADAMVSYDVTKNVSLQLNLNNLFDKEYVASVNNGGSRYIPGVARNALLTANLSF